MCEVFLFRGEGPVHSYVCVCTHSLIDMCVSVCMQMCVCVCVLCTNIAICTLHLKMHIKLRYGNLQGT